ncbi:MAG: cytochrome c oxidase assembly protein, partial [Alphaproteobacteria bacterium]|nr:cytochrome c oxidase assembly protein [Alphaproteobacteria bacterium]
MMPAAGSALAHVEATVTPRSLAWNWEPWILGSLAAAVLCYTAGVVRLRRRVGRAGPLRVGHMTAFAAGMASLLVVLVSPLDGIADQLFWVHMVQHLVLLLAAAPLLVLGRPALAFLWAFGPRGRKRVGRWWSGFGIRRGIDGLMHPVLVWLLFCGVFVSWHFPGPYQAALANEGVHTLEHLSFLVTALMFWSIVIEPSGRRRLGHGPTLVFVVTAAILSGLPGALIALAPRPLYPAHAAGEAEWGLSPIADQQLAGVVMWIPGGVIYLVAAACLFLRWLQHESESSPSAVSRARWLALLVCLLPVLLGGCNDEHGRPATAAIGDADRGIGLIRSY